MYLWLRTLHHRRFHGHQVPRLFPHSKWHGITTRVRTCRRSSANNHFPHRHDLTFKSPLFTRPFKADSSTRNFSYSPPTKQPNFTKKAVPQTTDRFTRPPLPHVIHQRSYYGRQPLRSSVLMARLASPLSDPVVVPLQSKRAPPRHRSRTSTSWENSLTRRHLYAGNFVDVLQRKP